MTDRDQLIRLLETFRQAADLSVTVADACGAAQAESMDPAHRHAFVTEDMNAIFGARAPDMRAQGECRYYAYTSESMLCYLAVPALCLGPGQFLIAGPYLSYAPDGGMIEQIIGRKGLPISHRIPLSAYYGRLPVVPPGRSPAVGRLLYALAMAGMPPAERVECALRPQKAPDVREVASKSEESGIRHIPLALIRQLQKEATKGDMVALGRLVDTISMFPAAELAENDALRSAKNNLIAISGIASMVAVNGGANYEIAQSLCDSYIRAAEKLRTVEDVMHLLKSLFLRFSSITSWHSDSRFSKPVHDAIQYACAHLSEKVPLEALARAVGLSPNHLSALFRRETGMPAGSYVAMIRVEEAKFLLLNTSRSVLQIAEETGFSYQNHFARVFRKVTGATPLQFRRNRGIAPG